jgi:hypothetical protein
MRLVITVLGALFLLATVYLVAMNWACAIISLQNKRKGIRRHHSMIPIVSAWLAMFALVMWPFWPGKWVLLLPALDIANLNLLASPIYLLMYLLRKRRSPPARKQ